MAIFTAIAAAIGLTGFAAAAFTFVGRTLLTIGISRLLARRSTQRPTAGGDGGGRVQIPPATDNKLPVIYGKAFVGGPVTDAKISNDLKTMWYVVSLAEVTDTTAGSSYTFGNVYYDGKLVTFGTDGVVASLTTNTTPPQVDNRTNDKLWIYLFNNGSSSGTNTGGKTAQQIISTAEGVPSGQEWTATDAMTNCAFAIVKVKYNVDAGLTNLGSLQVETTNSINKPGDALKDYMLNTRYGCAIPLERIDTASLTALNTYSDQTITYEPVGGGTATQARYRVNGPIDTASDCLTNLQHLVDTCDCWLQYSELSGKWKVIINQSYTNYTTFNNLFLVNSYNLVGGIDISPIDLNETYNELEVAYPNKNIKDQTDYQVVELSDYQSGVMSPNEAVNRLNIQLPLVNEAVQAKYLGVRRLLQSREDLVVTFSTDYSGIQVEAGDVIKITHETYGWTNKLFRVNNVAEEKYPDGNLGANIQAFEYNDTIYGDNAIKNFVPEFNTGLTDPNVIGQPTVPIVTNGNISNNSVNYFTVSSNVPFTGSVLYMDFNVGNTSNVLEHERFTTVTTSDGRPFTNSSNVANNEVTANISTLPGGNYYFSATARNPFGGRQSNSSVLFNWPGPGVSPNVTTNFCNASSNGNIVTSDPVANLQVGANLVIISGNGTLAANTYVAQVTSNTTFVVSATPTVALSNACLRANIGGINGNTIQPNTITGNNIANFTITNLNIALYTITANLIANGAITNIAIGNNTIIGNNIANYTILNNNIANYTIVGNNIANGAICTQQLCSNVTNILNNAANQTQILGNTLYSVADRFANTIVTPIDASANTTRNVPIYIIGTSVNANNYYPFYQGTSSTTFGNDGNNYYGANSSGSFSSIGAATLLVNDGEDDWYKLIYKGTSGLYTSSDVLTYEYDFQAVSNVDATIQVVSGIQISPDNYFNLATDYMSTIQLKANQPIKPTNYTQFWVGSSIANVTNAAVFIRNITANANVTIVSAGFYIGKR